MLFNSYPFLFVYLPIVLFFYFFLAKRSALLAIQFLALASLVFYSYWTITNLPLLLVSIAFNFFIGRRISEGQNQITRRWLYLGVMVNLSALIYFKYSYFVISSVANLMGWKSGFVAPELPLGISFYTFTQIAYLVDTWRGDARRDKLSTYALFVTFFPHLVAGPILHHKKILPQFQDEKNFRFSDHNMFRGLAILVLGLFKKVVIADTLAKFVGPVFSNTASAGVLESWAGVLSYTLQLYFDFSGYSDMAVGLAWMLNIDIPINFNSPYKSTSIIDFWRRWHISLSAFLRDYLYIPLGGNRYGELRRYINLFLTMFLGGIWHGAGFTFVLWGALHGFYLIINHFLNRLSFRSPKILNWLVTFILVMIAWVPFRAENIVDTFELYSSMTGLKSSVGVWDQSLLREGALLKSWLLSSVCLAIVVFLPNSQEIVAKLSPSRKLGFVLSVIAVISLVAMNRVSEFLYFQF